MLLKGAVKPIENMFCSLNKDVVCSCYSCVIWTAFNISQGIVSAIFITVTLMWPRDFYANVTAVIRCHLRKLPRKFKRKKKRSCSWLWHYPCHRRRLLRRYMYVWNKAVSV